MVDGLDVVVIGSDNWMVVGWEYGVYYRYMYVWYN
jgi:hypothetical protein